MTVANAEGANAERTRRLAGWALIAGLLLRIPFDGGIRAIVWPGYPDRVQRAYEIGAYALTALLIVWERERLAACHVTGLALGIFALGPVVEPVVQLALGSPTYAWRGLIRWPEIGVGIALLILLLAQRGAGRLGRDRTLWLGVTVAGGIVMAVGVGILVRLQQGVLPRGLQAWRPGVGATLFVMQLTRAAVYEEPLFRGFQWGYLRRAGWADGWVWLAQAGLFWVAHGYYLGRSPLSFWLVVPLGGLALGLLAWHARSIGASLIGHGLLNGIGQLVAYYDLQHIWWRLA